LIHEAEHDAFVAQNLIFTIKLTSLSGGVAEIVLPHAAFDLTVTLPIVDAPSCNFPLQHQA